MDKIMRILAPRSSFGMAARAVFFMAMIAVANVVFSFIYHEGKVHDRGYYVNHAIFVDAPFVIFFFVIMLYQMKLQKQLWKSACKDGLTGLNNRNTFLDLATRRQITSTSGVLLLLDADRFKAINDIHGHQTGDNCLQAIAKTMQAVLRKGDVVGRIGGEEFAILLPGISLDQAKAIASRFTRPISFKSEVDQQTHWVTLSVGAVVTRPELSLHEMMAYADKGLYTAKANGRAQLVVWDELPQQPVTI